MATLSRRTVMRLGLFAGTLPIASWPVVNSEPSHAAEIVPLAIKGYDPVAYFTLGAATRGLPEFEYEWDEHRYRFARAEHLDLFKTDPARYAPQFAGFCAVALSEAEVFEGNPEYWLVSGDRLYLFGKPIGPSLFQQDLAGNIAKAEQNRIFVQNR